MRIFVAFEDVRLPLDVQPGQTIGDVKTVLRDHFKLNSSHVEGKILQLTYAGAVLHDTWVCSDIGITSGATVKSALKESDKPVLHIDCPFNGEIVVIRDQLDPSKTYISDLRSKVSVKVGLPVSVFRLCTSDGKEMFDNHTLERYGVTLGSNLTLHVWDGWGDLLMAATQGHTKKVFKYSSSDEQIARFQFRVACYIAAHFGHVDLANSMINPKLAALKPEEPVGQHPAKLWSRDSAHIDSWKCPVHEAAECGKLNVLRIFVQNNICSLIAKDGNGHNPVQVCCKHGQTDCVTYLTSKMYSSHTENTVTLPVIIVIKSRKWCERARERVLLRHGAFCSSMRRRLYKPAASVGHGVIVDGYRESPMQSRPKVSELAYIAQLATDAGMPLPGLTRSNRHFKSLHRRNKSSSQDLKSASFGRDKKLSATSSSGFMMARHSGRLPNLSGATFARHRFASRGNDDTPTDETDSASYIQTPKPGQHSRGLPIIKEGKHANITRRAKLIEGDLSLPAVSVENTLRPFFHVSSLIQNPVSITLSTFEKYRGFGSRDNAIQCMIVAGTFKDKAWLRQVDMAISLAKRGVHNSLRSQTADADLNRMARSLPTVASSPIKVRV